MLPVVVEHGTASLWLRTRTGTTCRTAITYRNVIRRKSEKESGIEPTPGQKEKESEKNTKEDYKEIQYINILKNEKRRLEPTPGTHSPGIAVNGIRQFERGYNKAIEKRPAARTMYYIYIYIYIERERDR